ncbi:hypothetical protein N2152v2_002052 [Parachlorella kessleri]
MQRVRGRRKASSEPSSQESDLVQSFTKYCNQRRIGYDKTFLWCCLAVLAECYARFRLSFTPWGLTSMAASMAWVLAALVWAYRRPSSYAAWRQPVVAFVRVSRWALPYMHTIQLVLLEQEPTRYGGGFQCYAALIVQALLGSGCVAVIHGSLTAPLCLPWQAAVVCAELLLVVPRSGVFCHSISLRHSMGIKATHAVHELLEWLMPPWTRLATSVAAAQGAAAISSGLGGSAAQPSTDAGGGGQCDQCWAVMVVLLCCLGGVLPLLIVLGEGFARLHAHCTAWGVGCLAAFVVCAVLALAWANRRPDSYAANRQWVIAFLRISRWTLPLTYTMQLALLGSDPTQFGGGFLGHAVYLAHALIGSGLVGVVHGSLAAPLCLPWQVVVICTELSLVILRQFAQQQPLGDVSRYSSWSFYHVCMRPGYAMSTAATGSTAGAAASTGAVVVYVTVPSKDVGRKIADSLVESKLAACVNIIPGLESIYVWEGKVNRDEELLLMIKSRESLVAELTQHVKGLHPYDECEVISLPISGGSMSYLKWVMDSTKELGT